VLTGRLLRGWRYVLSRKPVQNGLRTKFSHKVPRAFLEVTAIRTDLPSQIPTVPECGEWCRTCFRLAAICSTHVFCRRASKATGALRAEVSNIRKIAIGVHRSTGQMILRLGQTAAQSMNQPRLSAQHGRSTPPGYIIANAIKRVALVITKVLLVAPDWAGRKKQAESSAAAYQPCAFLALEAC